MKKHSILCSIFTFLMMLFSVTGFAQINTNGGFEDWTGSWPAGWHGSKTNIDSVNVTCITAGAHSGNKACQLKLVNSHKRFTMQPVSVTVGEKYIVSFWAKGHGKIHVGVYNGPTTSNGYVYNSDDHYFHINNAQYVYCEDTLTITNTLVNAEFILGVKNSSDNSNDTLIIDDVSVTMVVDEDFVEQPVATIAGDMLSSDVYIASATVSLSTLTEGADIYYTLDGSDPTASSSLYSTPITITTTTTLKAIAMLNGNSSNILTRTISIVSNPLFFEDFETDGLNEMTVATVSGEHNWTAATYGGNYYAYANAYYNNESHAGETWLITPAITPLNAGGVILSFDNATKHSGPALQVKYSNNYTGSGSPEVATWTDITGECTFSSGNWVWVNSGNVEIPGAAPVYFAWVYTSTGAASGGSAGWEVDNILVMPGDAPVNTPSLAITAPANGSTFSTLDTLPLGVDCQNFTLGTDGYLKVETPLLTTIGQTNPLYLDQTGLSMLLQAVLSPLPAGTHTITCSLVDMNQTALNPAVTATTTFTVVAPQLAEPIIQVEGMAGEEFGTYYFNATISITAEAGASIRYTTDNSEPTEASTLYTGPFQITTTSTIKAIAVKANYQNSNVASEYVIVTAPTVPTPEFDPTPGTHGGPVTVTITCDTYEEVDIRYTLDGNEPTESSTLYILPFTLDSTTTVKAKAFKANWLPSETATAVYTIVYDPTLVVSETTLNFTSTQLQQVFTVSGAHLDNPITLTCSNPHFTVNPSAISSPNANTEVTVTFDGTEPATGFITVVSDTLSAQVALTATAQLPAPEFTADITDTMVTVTMSCSVADAAIHYTIDGAEPTTASTAYTQALVFDNPGIYTVKAIAVKSGWENSVVTTGIYTVNEPPTPQPLDSVIYAVGFEEEEGFEGGNYYQNTNVSFKGPDGAQWGTYYGTPSTYKHIVGAQSMQMRWYTSAAHNMNFGYTYTNFDLHNVTHVTFLAKNTNGLNVRVSHSVDGGNTYSTGQVYTLDTIAQAFDYVVDETGSVDYVRLKFTIELPDPIPTATSYLIIDSVVVFGIPGIAPSLVSTPVISPSTGYYYEPQTVTITCADSDAVIRYTTDGSVPTENSTVYSESFIVTTTTTITAKAWKTDMAPSTTATVTISFPKQVENIAAFKAAAATNVEKQIMSDVTFVFRSGRFMFVEDNTGSLLIYDYNNPTITTAYNEGDVIEGGIFGKYTLYNGMVEMLPTHNSNAATGTPVTVTPTDATVAQVKAQYANVYESKLVHLSNVMFIDDEKFVQDGDTMAIFDRFNTVDITFSAGNVADVTGFISYSTNYGYQIFPRGNEDVYIHPVVVMDTVATPVFNVSNDGDSYHVNITCATAGATIYYTIDGGNPDENSNVFTAEFPMDMQHHVLKAIAMKEGMVNSEVAVYDYNPSGINTYELRDNINVYPNPAINYVTVSVKNENLSIEKVELYNIYGQLLSKMNVNGSTVEISVGTLSTGTYFAKVYTDKGVATMPVIRK